MKLTDYKGYQITVREEDGLFIATEDGEEVARSERLVSLYASLDRRDRPKKMEPVAVYVGRYGYILQGTMTSWDQARKRGRVTVDGRSDTEFGYDLYAVTPANTAKVNQILAALAQVEKLRQEAAAIVATLEHYQPQEAGKDYLKLQVVTATITTDLGKFVPAPEG